MSLAHSQIQAIANRSLLFTVLLLTIGGARVFAQPETQPKPLPEPRDAAVRERERKALIEFYNALGGPDWIERDFWGSDRPVGEWHGVTTLVDNLFYDPCDWRQAAETIGNCRAFVG